MAEPARRRAVHLLPALQWRARNYDGFGRNASDNDSLFVYAWFTY
ncbi:MAG TPA: hypothetical protein VIP05_16790 [Burkholderiaceae bacterium]